MGSDPFRPLSFRVLFERETRFSRGVLLPDEVRNVEREGGPFDGSRVPVTPGHSSWWIRDVGGPDRTVPGRSSGVLRDGSPGRVERWRATVHHVSTLVSETEDLLNPSSGTRCRTADPWHLSDDMSRFEKGSRQFTPTPKSHRHGSYRTLQNEGVLEETVDDGKRLHRFTVKESNYFS